MSEEAAAPAAGGGDPYGVSAIIGAINGAIDGWYDREMQRRYVTAHDPCYARQEFTEYRMNVLGPAIRDALMAAQLVSDDGQRAINMSIHKWGRPDTAYIRSMRFTDYLQENGVVLDNMSILLGLAVGGPVGAIIAAATFSETLDERLSANGHQAPSGSNRGYKVGPGVYLYDPSGAGKHALYGRLQGSEVRRAYWSWKTLQRLRVAPVDHNEWRDKLIRLVGRSRDDWTIWREGDPWTEGSKMGALMRMQEIVESEEARVEQLCIEENARADRIEDLIVGGQLQLWIDEGRQGDVGLEATRAKTEAAIKIAVVLGLGAVGVSALLGD